VITFLAFVGLVILGFLAGSIPVGAIVARRRGVDIQREGSGNIGATNVTRVLGILPGVIVLVLDTAKGALPVWLATRCLAPWPVTAVGAAAILGHCFTPWLGFRGGKGVAVAFGVFLVLAPPVAAIAAGTFAIVVAATRVPALGSLSATAILAAILLARGPAPSATLALATLTLLLYTHRENLAKLLARAR
jgi:glycerol-3-phosphate acyltransferase PlsY